MNADSNNQKFRKMKETSIKYMIMVLLAGFTLTSCDKYLDIEPKQQINAETAIQSGEDVQLLLISAYEGIKGTRGTSEAGELYGGSFNFASEMIAGTDDVVWDGRYFDSNGSFVNESQPMGIKYSNDGEILEVYNPNGKVHLYKLEKPFDITSTPVYIGDRKQEDKK
ncbi:hypothetical protein LCGC14_2051670 [marine sediment metagenome]|uniref:Uncharacterized protein n=1 Tax=marine sediment metagenome TaxID=412755 RepID=A0A0F9EP07_9ZZZZ